MISYRKINIASEKILNYSYFKFASYLEKDCNFGYINPFFKDNNAFMSVFFYKDCVIRI